MFNEQDSVVITQIKDIATILGVLIALFTLIKYVLEYVRQGAQKRADYFFDLQARLSGDQRYKKVYNAIIGQEEVKMDQIGSDDKFYFMSRIEEVAIMVNSKLLKKEVAKYWFYLVLTKCWNNAEFWNDGIMSKKDPYWSLFSSFIKKLGIKNEKEKGGEGQPTATPDENKKSISEEAITQNLIIPKFELKKIKF